MTFESGVYWQLFIDGASRGNPGPAGAGVFLLKNGAPFLSEGFFLGVRTNNQAEYLALLIGLFLLRDAFKAGDQLAIFSDSQLMVRHILGEYKVRNGGILPLFLLARKSVKEFGAVITHVLRHDNKQADKMANKGVDDALLPSGEFVAWLHAHDISF